MVVERDGPRGGLRVLEVQFAGLDLADEVLEGVAVDGQVVVLRHAPGPQIRVRLTRERHGVLLEVWDSSDEVPEEVAMDGAAPGEGTSGRGLPIVAALALECGVTPAEPHGKWAWARVQE